MGKRSSIVFVDVRIRGLRIQIWRSLLMWNWLPYFTTTAYGLDGIKLFWWGTLWLEWGKPKGVKAW